MYFYKKTNKEPLKHTKNKEKPIFQNKKSKGLKYVYKLSPETSKSFKKNIPKKNKL